MSLIIITPQTATATSGQFYVASGAERIVSAKDLSGAEYVDILVQHGNTFIPSGVENRLTVTNPVKAISGIGNFKVQKSATVNAVSVAFAV